MRVNTARGELADTQALRCALDKSHLREAGLDVIAGEEVFSKEQQFLQNLNTPENGLKAAEGLLNTTVIGIQAFRSGDQRNVVPS